MTAKEVTDQLLYFFLSGHHLVGFPIWWYEAPRIIRSFLENYDLTDKTVIPFATSGGSEMGNTDSILQRSAPAAHWKLGKRLRADASVAEIAAWVEDLNS